MMDSSTQLGWEAELLCPSQAVSKSQSRNRVQDKLIDGTPMTGTKLTQWINKLVDQKGYEPAYHWLRRAVVFCIGMTVLLIGITLLVLPGPAILVIPMGLALLATEFVWAKKLLQTFKKETTKVADSIKQTFSRGKSDDRKT